MSKSEMSNIFDAMNRNSQPEIIVTDTDFLTNDILTYDSSLTTNGNESLQGISSDILTETFNSDIFPQSENVSDCDVSKNDSSTGRQTDILCLKGTCDVILNQSFDQGSDFNLGKRQITSACPGINVTNTENLAEKLIEQTSQSAEQLDDEISALRLSTDLVYNEEAQSLDHAKSPSLSKPFLNLDNSNFDIRHRRRSPVTVQEWVASLPPPHLMRRQSNETQEEGDETDQRNNLGFFDASSELDDSFIKNERIGLRSEPKKTEDLSDQSKGRNQTDFSEAATKDSILHSSSIVKAPTNEDRKLETLKQTHSSRLGDNLHNVEESNDSGNKNVEGKTFDGTFRRLSAAFEAMEAAEKEAMSSSDEDEERRAKERSIERSNLQLEDEDNDQIELGEEASSSTGYDNSSKGNNKSRLESNSCPSPTSTIRQSNDWLSQANQINELIINQHTSTLSSYFVPPCEPSLDARRMMLLRSHEQYASMQSNISAKSVASIESVFLSRAVDPGELLMDLGFGGAPSSAFSRIPSRFFTSKSNAKGISVEDFLKKQEELTEKFDSGYNGYRGLNGSPSTRPSKLVEKIIDKIRTQDREMKRQWSSISAVSLAISQSKKLSQSLPSKNLKKSLQNIQSDQGLNFAQLVQRAWSLHNPQQTLGTVQEETAPANKFRAIANSVLSPANRLFRAEQAKRAADARNCKDKNKRRIVLGGQAFSVNDDDLSVVQVDDPVQKAERKCAIIEQEENDVVPELGSNEDHAVYRRLSGGPKRAPPLGMLHKQDSMASVTSSCSVESDWSDEEIEELEKMFGHIQEKSTAADRSEPGDGDPAASMAHWRKLRRTRRIAIQLQRSRKLSRKMTGGSTTSMGTASTASEDGFGVDDNEEDEGKRWEAKLIFSRYGGQASRSLDQIDLGSGLLNADCTLEETEGLPTKEEDSKSENL